MPYRHRGCIHPANLVLCNRPALASPGPTCTSDTVDSLKLLKSQAMKKLKACAGASGFTPYHLTMRIPLVCFPYLSRLSLVSPWKPQDLESLMVLEELTLH